jgi:hypothetical protein
MIRSLVAMLLLGFVVMPESKPCVTFPRRGDPCRWCPVCNVFGLIGICGGRGNIETTYGELRRGYIPAEGEAQ